jgi:hypothetical protein
MGLWKKLQQDALKQQERKAEAADRRAGKTLHRTGRQLTKRNRAEQRAEALRRSLDR